MVRSSPRVLSPCPPGDQGALTEGSRKASVELEGFSLVVRRRAARRGKQSSTRLTPNGADFAVPSSGALGFEAPTGVEIAAFRVKQFPYHVIYFEKPPSDPGSWRSPQPSPPRYWLARTNRGKLASTRTGIREKEGRRTPPNPLGALRRDFPQSARSTARYRFAIPAWTLLISFNSVASSRFARTGPSAAAVHPEVCRRTQELGKSKCRARRHPSPLVHQVRSPTTL